MSLGVLLTRAQPFTEAHLGLVKQILEENDEACIVIGSADKSGTERNPLDIKTRMLMVQNSLFYDGIKLAKVTIFGLPDWLNENNQDSLVNWGHYFYYNVVGRTGCKTFKLYYSDGEDILNSWFDDEVRPYITYVCQDRSKNFDGISSTQVRNIVLETDDRDLLRQKLDGLLPKGGYYSFEIMCKQIRNANKKSKKRWFK